MPTEEAGRDDLLAKDVADRLPRDIVDALTEDQMAILHQVISEARPWRGHPINLRATWPTGFRRFFFNLVAGADRRNPERREQDRKIHPIMTRSNWVFLGIAVVAIYTVIGATALIVASIIRST